MAHSVEVLRVTGLHAQQSGGSVSVVPVLNSPTSALNQPHPPDLGTYLDQQCAPNSIRRRREVVSVSPIDVDRLLVTYRELPQT
jgi:hypothetical protein